MGLKLKALQRTGLVLKPIVYMFAFFPNSLEPHSTSVLDDTYDGSDDIGMNYGTKRLSSCNEMVGKKKKIIKNSLV